MSQHHVRIRVNGRPYEATVPAQTSLADLLRDHLDLTGTHLGCEHGVCGVCSVIVDGEASRSCTILAASVDGSEIRTVEGLAEPGSLDDLQAAFQREHGLQCGFCTPGFLMSLTPLLEQDQAPTREAVHDALEGVACRCTGYVNVLAAAEAAVAERFGAAAR
jgi:aerobic-type carbon monoxide dehydrogenase small subunit (CoxS/CutS family)